MAATTSPRPDPALAGSAAARLRTLGAILAAPALLGAAALGVAARTGHVPGAALLLAAGVGLGAWMAHRALCPLDRLGPILVALRELARGRGGERLSPSRMGPLRSLAAEVERTRDRVSASASRIAELSRRLGPLPEHVAALLADVEAGAEHQEAAVEETAAHLANLNSSIRAINAEIENLARSNEETASSILEMGSAIDQVAQGAATLEKTVESSTTSLHEMGASIRRVAESSDTVQEMAEETASSIAEMDRTIQEVGEHVRGALELTEAVTQSADEGSGAVGDTIVGIASIRDLTLGAKTALEGLAERIGEIGEIATVIGGISDETNLLSLNASIIAAQSGEHGRAFAVVAEQVKTLARRTTSSAKQIERLITAVQAESENAVRAMGAGIEGVEDGVARSRRAGEALETIRTAARDATGRVAEITRAAEEQARNSRYVADAAQRTSGHVQQISVAMGEQTRASEHLLRNATASLDMCRQVAQATHEQRGSSHHIAANSTSITEMIRSIQERTASHAETSRAVADTVSAILDAAHKSGGRMPEVSRAVEELRALADEVRAEVERFEGRLDQGSDSTAASATHRPA